MESLEKPAEAAGKVVRAWCEPWVKVAARTRGQQEGQADFSFTASGDRRNLIDVSNEKVRKEAGMPVSAWDVGLRYGKSDPCRDLMREYSFDISNDDENWFYRGLIAAFVAENEEKLKVCDRFGYGMADPENARILVSAALPGWDGKDLNTPTVRDFKWDKFKVLVHEHIHVFEHPIVPTATGKSWTVREGVCEYLIREVLQNLPEVLLNNLQMRQEVTRLIHGDDTPRDYESLRQYPVATDYKTAVQQVEKAAAIIGKDALLAAFFQGHVEFLGLDPLGKEGYPVQLADDGTRMVFRPETAPTLEELAEATGKNTGKLIEDYPYLDEFRTGRLPPGLQIKLPGFHVHWVVTSEKVSESWDDIATQQGVTKDALTKANPDISEPSEVRWLLVPEAGK